MPDPNELVEGPAVSWQLDAPDLSLGRLVEWFNEVMGLLRDIQSEVVPAGGVQWLVESISKTSPLAMKVAPVATRGQVRKRELQRVSTAVTSGLRQIQRKPIRPPHFSDAALTRAHRLVASSRSQHTRIQVGSQTLDAQFLANVEKILGPDVRAIGTIEGRLEAINVHGETRNFVVYDALTGEGIRCNFGRRISTEQIGRALEHRVAVHGEITYRESGSIVRIAAQSLEVFPSEEELPTADDVRGILA